MARRKPLKRIAKVAREQMERFASRYRTIGFPQDLSCYCAIASFFLWRLAREYGYELELAEGNAFDRSQNPKRVRTDDVNHCWVVHEGVIYDLTATQFKTKIAKVYITEVGDPDYKVYQQGNRACRTAFSEKWPAEQNPLHWVNEMRPFLNAAKAELA